MKKNIRFLSWLLLLEVASLITISDLQAQSIYYVDDDASGNTNGTSWVDAYTDLQTSLNIAIAGDTIYVAGGTYKPSIEIDFDERGGSDSREATFQIPDSVIIFGGFAGTENTPISQNVLDERDFATNPSILSGDIGTINDSSDNVYHVIYTHNVSATTVLDGFTITNGNANSRSFPNSEGGGWYSIGSGSGNVSNPTIRNCIFENNLAYYGAGIYADATSDGVVNLSLVNCLFRNNLASATGGGIFFYGNNADAPAKITNCVFDANNEHISYIPSESTETELVFTNCIFFGATKLAVVVDHSIREQMLPVFINCIFWDNAAMEESAIIKTINVKNSIVQNDAYLGYGNINRDPLFRNAENGDFTLLPSSPAINTGNNDPFPDDITVDAAGNERIQGSIIDMGAFESPYYLIFTSLASTSFFEHNTEAVLDINARIEDNELDAGITYSLSTGGDNDLFNVNPNSGVLTFKTPPDFENPRSEDSDNHYEIRVIASDGTSLTNQNISIWVLNILDGKFAYVNDDASGTGTGNSWTNAYTDLQSALRAARAGDTIYVAAGTYKPTNGIDISSLVEQRKATFQIPDSVVLFGGYAGTETMPNSQSVLDARDFNLNASILSGDIGELNDSTDNAYHVVYTHQASSATLADGFTITYGNANAITGLFTSDNKGGGWYNDGRGNGNSSSPTIRNCVFDNNTASNYDPGYSNAYGNGAGMYNDGRNSGTANPSLINCVFQNNSAYEGNGGGMYNDGRNNGTANPSLVSCAFKDNFASNGREGSFYGNGGGIYNDGSNSGTAILSLINCNFQNNLAFGGKGGGLYNNANNLSLTECTFEGNNADANDGGGVYNSGNNLSFANCIFENNVAYEGNGGGVYNSGNNISFMNGMFRSNLVHFGNGAGIYNYADSDTANLSLVGCTFQSNTTHNGGNGAGMYNYANGIYAVANPSLLNCTFENNSAVTNGGGLYNHARFGIASPSLLNCTFENNLAAINGGGMYNHGNSGVASPSLVNCTFRSNTARSGTGGICFFGDYGELAAKITNCIFDQNNRHIGYNDGLAGTQPIFTNCTFWKSTGAAIRINNWNSGQTPLDFINCIFWGNGLMKAGKGGTAALNVRHSIIQDNAYNGAENINSNPLFTNPMNGDFTLLQGSPAINAGINDSLPEGITTDIIGNERIQGLTVDMGAFESPYYFTFNSLDSISFLENNTDSVLDINAKTSDATMPDLGITYSLATGEDNDLFDINQNNGVLTFKTPPDFEAPLDMNRDNRYEIRVTAVIPTDSIHQNISILVLNVLDGGLAYVDDNASGDSTGNSWIDAYTDLQIALGFARPGDTIYVAAGTYKPTNRVDIHEGNHLHDREASFQIPDSVTLLGGFAGTESMPSSQSVLNARDFSANPSILSGDIGIVGDSTDNVFHVVYTRNVSSVTLLDGFTITGGEVVSTDFYSVDDGGAGWYNMASGSGNLSSPTIRNCIFENNNAEDGGGMFNNGENSGIATPSLTDCIFKNNTANYGGGMFNNGGARSTANPSLTNCVFQNNMADNGGGMYNLGETSGIASPSLTNCLFENNMANNGGGMLNDGLANGIASPSLMNCVFQNNTADYGGGINNNASGGNVNASLISCTFKNNTATYGGGIRFFGNSSGSLNTTVINCVFYQNNQHINYHHNVPATQPIFINCTFLRATEAVIHISSRSFDLAPLGFVNCIFWDNTAMHTSKVGSGVISINYSIVEESAYADGTGNVTSNPRFIDPISGDFRLLQGSPAINAGNNAAIPANIVTDIVGNQRIREGIVDMGAIESLDISSLSRKTAYVDDDASGAGDGTSWTDAYANLQAALYLAKPGDTIYVAAGIYKPINRIDFDESNELEVREATFQIPDSVTLFGGFAGTESMPGSQSVLDARDFANNSSILSGDIGVIGSSSDNAYHVVYTHSVSPSTIVDGITITGGNANGGNAPNDAGGGWYNDGSDTSSSPILRNCSFSNNSASSGGGGLYNDGNSASVSLTLQNCSFSNNSANSGGGLYNDGSDASASPILRNCSFSNNSASSGGGLYNDGSGASSSLTLRNCSFSNNSASSSGGGLYNGGSPSPGSILYNCVFSDNSASSGGGLYNSSRVLNAYLVDCVFKRNRATNRGGGMIVSAQFGGDLTLFIMNCVFEGNSAVKSGGGMHFLSDEAGRFAGSIINCLFDQNDQHISYFIAANQPTFINCTFSGATKTAVNVDVWNPLFYYPPFPPPPLNFANCIFWGNAAMKTGRDETEILNVTYSIIQDNTYTGNGNIHKNPLFTNAESGDFTLLSGSSAVNTGINDSVPTGVITDIAGNERIQRARVDMGAFESPHYLTFTSLASAYFPEHNTGPVLDVNARIEDNELDSGITYSLSMGQDSDLFSINSDSGILTFNIPPDYELPLDEGKDNYYNLLLEASDGMDTVRESLTIKVTDENDPPVLILADTISVREGISFVVKLSGMDEDTGSILSYRIASGLDSANFEIQGSDTLRFKSSPDYESALDVGGNNHYNLSLEVSDGMDTVRESLTIKVTDANDPPVLPLADTISVREGINFVVKLSGMDEDTGSILSYRIASGLDSANFEIQGLDTLRFKFSPDYESALDVGGNNHYNLSLEVSDGVNTVRESLTVKVTDENEYPPVLPLADTISVREGINFVVKLPGMDADAGSMLSYRIYSGLDSANFEIQELDTLRFKSFPDYESPLDVGVNNHYNLSLEVSDGLNTVRESLTVKVTDENDLPVLILADTISVREGSRFVLKLLGTDADAGSMLSYRMASGLDSANFEIQGLDTLRFKSSPDYESPLDVGGDNHYNLLLEVSDGMDTVRESLTVKVTDENDPPVLPLADTISVKEGINFVVKLPGMDEDPGSVLSYRIAAGLDSTNFEIQGLDTLRFKFYPDYESPLDVGGDNYYNLSLEVSDGVNTVRESLTVKVTDENEYPPVLILADTISVKEGINFVVKLPGTDADAGSMLSYRIAAGLDSTNFEIQGLDTLRFKFSPDYESALDVGGDNYYNLLLEVSDGLNTARESLTVKVTDENDPPVLPLADTISVREGINFVVKLPGMDEDPGSVLSYRIASSLDSTNFEIQGLDTLRFKFSPDYESALDIGGDNHYNLLLEVSDGVNTVSESLTVKVTDENDPPVLTLADTISVREGISFVIKLSGTDADAGSMLSYRIAAGLDSANFEIQGLDTLRFKFSPDYESALDMGGNNHYHLSLEVSDGVNTARESLTVKVTDENDPPVLVLADTISVREGSRFVLKLLGTDEDAGSMLSYRIAAGLDSVNFEIQGLDTLRFKSSPDYESPLDMGRDNHYHLSLEVSDGLNTVRESLTVKVTDENDPPVLILADTISVREGSRFVLKLLGTDSDAGSMLSYRIASGLDSASFEIQGLDTLRFKSSPDYEMSLDAGGDNYYHLSLEVSDGVNTVRESLTVKVTDENDPPVLILADTISVREGINFVVKLSGTDADAGSMLSYRIAAGLDSANFEIQGLDTLRFKFSPDYESPLDVGGNNHYNLSLEVSDGVNTVSESLTVKVTDENDSPVLVLADTISVREGSRFVLKLLGTDEDAGSMLSYRIAAGLDSVNFEIQGLDTLRFKSSPDHESPLDVGRDNHYNLSLEVSDGVNTVRESLTVKVTDENDPPVLILVDTISVREGINFVVKLSGTDEDPGSMLSYRIAAGLDSANFEIQGLDTLRFKSYPDYESPLDVGGDNHYNLSLEVSDGLNTVRESLTVKVTDENDPPVLPLADTISVKEGNRFVLKLLGTDADAMSMLSYRIVDGLDSTSFEIHGLDTLRFKFSPDYEYPLDVGVNNHYNLSLEVSDGVNIASESLTVKVTDENDPPVLILADTISVREGINFVMKLSGTDEDAMSMLSYRVVSGLDSASFEIQGLDTLRFKFSPDYESPLDMGRNNHYNLSLEVSDGVNTVSESLTVKVTDENDPPVLILADTISVKEGNRFVLKLLGTDADAMSMLSYRIVDGLDSTSFEIHGLDTLRFKFSPDYEYPLDVGVNNHYNLSLEVSDGVNIASESLTVKVTDENDPPVLILADTISVREGINFVMKLSGTDEDAMSMLSYRVVSGLDSASFEIQGLDTLRFKFSPDYESPLDMGRNNHYNLSLEVSDGVNTVSESLTVKVTDENDPPVLILADTISVREGINFVVKLSGTDADAGSMLSYRIAAGLDSANFEIQGLDTLRFKFSPDYESPLDVGGNNHYNLSLEVSDGVNTVSESLTVKVTEANDPPALTLADTISVREGSRFVLKLLGMDADAGSMLSYRIAAGLDSTNFEIQGLDTLRFKFSPDYESPLDMGGNNHYHLSLEVSDGVNTVRESLTVKVTDENDPPVLPLADTISVREGSRFVLKLLGTDADAGSMLSYRIAAGLDSVNFEIQGLDTLRFKFYPDYESPLDVGVNNHYNLSLEVSDGLNTVRESLTVKVTDENDPPVLPLADTISVREGSRFVLKLLGTDADAGSMLSYRIAAGLDSTNFEIQGLDTLRFKSSPDYELPLDMGANNHYNLSLEVSDGLNTVRESLTVKVTDENDPPVLPLADTISVREGSRFVLKLLGTDEDAGSMLSYRIAAGLDSASFEIQGLDTLRFKSSPDYESALDMGGDNHYNLSLEVSDGVNTAIELLTVKVTDANDPPVLILADTISVREGINFVAKLSGTDADAGSMLSYRIAAGLDSANFDIQGLDTLRFKSSPDYESALDMGGDNHYNLSLEVSDGVNTVRESLTVKVTDENDPPVLPLADTISVREGINFVVKISGTDEDAMSMLSYRIVSGLDSAIFEIQGLDTLRFKSSPDYESALDMGRNNHYNLSLEVSDGVNTVRESLVVKVTDANDSPVLILADTISVREGINFVAKLSGTDADAGSMLSYRIASGLDSASFEIQGLDTLRFKFSPDYESALDMGGDNHYNLSLEVSDGLNTVRESLTVKVTGENDPPVLILADTISVREGINFVVKLSGTDADAGSMLSYRVAAGLDSANFEIQGLDILRFKSSPDYESPLDVGGDNHYNLSLEVSDGVNTVSESLTVKVTDANDPPVLTLADTISVKEGINFVVKLSGTDADVGSMLSYRIAAGLDSASFEIQGLDTLRFKSSPDYESPLDVGGDNHYNLSLEVSDGVNTVRESLTVKVTDANEPPVLILADTISVREGSRFVLKLLGTDADAGSMLSYRIAAGLDSAIFEIQGLDTLRFKYYPDYESPLDVGEDNHYNLSVEVSDGVNTVREFLTVKVTDENDPPVLMLLDTIRIREGTNFVVKLSGTDPEGSLLSYRITSSLDSANFEIQGLDTLRFKFSPDYKLPLDVGGDNHYNLLLEVSDGLSATSKAITIIVIDENEVITHIPAENARIAIYPNPTTGLVFINIDNLTKVSIKISTIQGQVLFHRENVEGQIHALDILSEQRIGVYFMEITYPGNKEIFKILRE